MKSYEQSLIKQVQNELAKGNRILKERRLTQENESAYWQYRSSLVDRLKAQSQTISDEDYWELEYKVIQSMMTQTTDIAQEVSIDLHRNQELLELIKQDLRA